MIPTEVHKIIASCETAEQLITSQKWLDYIYRHHEEQLAAATEIIRQKLFQLSGDIFDVRNMD